MKLFNLTVNTDRKTIYGISHQVGTMVTKQGLTLQSDPEMSLLNSIMTVTIRPNGDEYSHLPFTGEIEIHHEFFRYLVGRHDLKLSILLRKDSQGFKTDVDAQIPLNELMLLYAIEYVNANPNKGWNYGTYSNLVDPFYPVYYNYNVFFLIHENNVVNRISDVPYKKLDTVQYVKNISIYNTKTVSDKSSIVKEIISSSTKKEDVFYLDHLTYNVLDEDTINFLNQHTTIKIIEDNPIVRRYFNKKFKKAL